MSFDLLTVVAILAGYVLLVSPLLLSVWTTYYRERSNYPDPKPPFGLIALFAVLSLLVLVFLWTWVATPRLESPNDEQHRYGAIIDAGSGGSRLAIFKWRFEKNGDVDVQQLTAVTEKDVGREKNCPLANIEQSDQSTCDCLLDIARTGRNNAVGEIRRSAFQPIPLWVKATAGVRALGDIAQQGRVLKAADRCLAKAPGYQWRGADVITGAEEGLYAWLAVNYLGGTLHGRALDSIGIVEVGGQSAQIAFRVPGRTSPAPSKGALLTVPFASGRLHVYSMSDDELGKEAAANKIREKLTTGKECDLDGDPSQCIHWIEQFLCDPALQSKNPCDNRKPEIQPPSELLFAGLSNFSYIVGNVGLSKANLKEVRAKADDICGKTKDADARKEAIKNAGKHKSDVCRDAFYLSQLAERVWGLKLESVAPAAARGAGDADWRLGAMIVEALQSRD